MHKIKVLILIITFLLLFNIISIRSEDEISENLFEEDTISANYTQEEKNRIEDEEITNPRRPYSLDFVSEKFTPNLGLDEKVVRKLRDFNNRDYVESNYTYGFIMINGVRTKEKLQEIKELNIKLLGSHSGHSYKAKIPLDKLNELDNLSFVRWVGYSKLKQKLHYNLFDRINIVNNRIEINDEKRNEEIPIYINLFDEDIPLNGNKSLIEKKSEQDKNSYKYQEIGEFGKVLENKGVRIIRYDEELKYYFAYAYPEIIKDILGLEFILNIEKQIPLTQLHDESMASISADYMRGVDDYDGSGIMVGLIDSGYEADHEDLIGADFGIDYTGENDIYNDPTGHGTHIAGTTWGRGIADAKYKGVAPGIDDIQIVKVNTTGGAINWEVATDWLAEDPPTKIVSVSLGASLQNCLGTDVRSREVDDHVYNNDQVYVVAAGNDGEQGEGWISSPGCAKNAITVGNVYDNFGEITDLISGTSSIGPTGDGRMKPDVVAPGCFINSTDYQNDGGYREMCGTSMATPHVTGMVTTLLDHYDWLVDHPDRVKAIVTSNAIVYEGDGNNIGSTYGHGKIDSYSTHWLRNNENGWTAGNFHGEVDEDRYVFSDIQVPNDANMLGIVLTWVEPAASANDDHAVINNLDLWVDRGANEDQCQEGEYSSRTDYDNKEYFYMDNPPGGTYRIKVCPIQIDGDLSPQEFAVSYKIIRGDVTPNTEVSVSVSDDSLYVDQEFTLTATVNPNSYVASGVYTEINMSNGIEILSMNTTREDGINMEYDGNRDNLNLGNIHEGDTRSITWKLRATNTGQKNISVNIDSSNGGLDSANVNVQVSDLKEDGEECNINEECESGFCDNDGVGEQDDYHCFTPYQTYFDGEEQIKCEYSTGQGEVNCDELNIGHNLNLCIGLSYYEEECSNSCGYTDETNSFECNENGCSCAAPQCDGLTIGEEISTCNYGATSYFSDKCTGNAGGEDRGDNICRSSAFAEGCTADPECDGVAAGTNDCSNTCVHLAQQDDPPSVNLITPTNNFVDNDGIIIFNCSVVDDYNLVNITLYGNWSGAWQNNETKFLAGKYNSTTFEKILGNGIYNWNCLAYDNSSKSDWGNYNYTLNVTINVTENFAPSNTSFIYPIGGETLSGFSTIKWITSVDMNGDFVRYFLQYSNNSGTNWYDLISGYGYENKLNGGSTQTQINFTQSENKTIYIRIPKNATLTNAKLDLTGWGAE